MKISIILIIKYKSIGFDALIFFRLRFIQVWYL